MPEGSNRKRQTCSSACRQKQYRRGNPETISAEDRAAIDRVNEMFRLPGRPPTPEEIARHVAATAERT